MNGWIIGFDLLSSIFHSEECRDLRVRIRRVLFCLDSLEVAMRGCVGLLLQEWSSTKVGEALWARARGPLAIPKEEA